MKYFLMLAGIGIVAAGLIVVGVGNPAPAVQPPAFQPPAILAAPIPCLNYTSPANSNGSFETATAGAPDGWAVVNSPALRWETNGDAAHSGSKSMLLRSEKATPDNSARIESPSINVAPGDIVKFSAWVFGDGGDPAKPPNVCAEAFAANQWTPLSPLPYFMRAPVGAWFPLASSVVVPPGVTQVRLVASADGSIAAGGTVWRLDDFQCEIVSLRAYVQTHQNAVRLPDVFLAGADTLRQSPLGCYGSTAGYTPNIDLLASEGMLFQNAITCSPWTRPSFASIFTSLYPSQHTAELHSSVLPDTVTTLAELLRAKGYFTAAFVKTRFDGFVGPGAGFAKGFDLFFHVDDEVAVDQAFDAFLLANADALSSIRGGGLFIFRHYYEPHATYQNRSPGLIVNKGLLGTRDLDGATLFTALYPQKPGVANADDVDYARRIYESEAIEVDVLLEKAFAQMRACGLYDRLNIILCSDHGESFNEKPGVWNHGNPYDTSVVVPLILRLPGRVTPGTRVDAVASTLDIMPTILELAGIDPPAQMQGISLLLPQNITSNRLLVSEDRKSGCIAIRGQKYKLVAMPVSLPRITGRDPYEYWKSIRPGVIEEPLAFDLLDGPRDWVLLGPKSPTRFELYDLEADPLENQNIVQQKPEIARSLLINLLAHCVRTGIFSFEELEQKQQFNLTAQELDTIKTAAEAAPASVQHAPSAIELTPDTVESLKSQGYFN